VLVGYAVLALALGRVASRRIVQLGVLAQLGGVGLALWDAGRVLVTGTPLVFEVPWTGPFFASRLALDPLAAVFVVALGLVGGAIAVYAPAYLEKAGHRLSPHAQQALLSLLEASILGVLIADDVVGFLLCWELMTAIATALVLADGHRPEVVRAAILYAVITHVGTLLAVAGFLWLGTGAADLSFPALREAASWLSPGARTAIALLTLVGFGTKAGMVPLHIWLPEAHPVAPSHVSALLSGVILKSGVYAILRVNLDLLAPAPDWFGFVLLALGLASALLGVLYALVQHDLKRLLAFHSVENIGIILLGVGLGVCAQNAGLTSLAAGARAAGRFQALTHAVFKALLFLCAGSVHLGTHTRDLEELGALARRMPSTARAFLIGAIAISALPPLNGFASEWLILQGFIGSASAPQGLLRASAPLLAAGLALTGALAAACFVKAYGVGFLALPRSKHAEQAVEAPRSMRVGQNFLALACIALGLGSPWVVAAISQAGARVDSRFTLLAMSDALGGAGLATVKPLALAAALVVAVGLGALVLRRSARQARSTLTWACGLGTVDGRAQYSATSFAKPIRRIFAGVFRPEREFEGVEGEAPYFVRRSRTHGSISPLFERYLYRPALAALHFASERVAPWSSGNLHRGLLLLSLTLAALLFWAAA